jgi:hypothetical protein
MLVADDTIVAGGLQERKKSALHMDRRRGWYILCCCMYVPAVCVQGTEKKNCVWNAFGTMRMCVLM